MKKIVVFDSHPVQYRVPIWKELSKNKNVDLHVVYATDCSVKGYNDTGFGTKVAWDGGMLDDYDNTILNSENGTPLKGWSSLTGKGVLKQIKDLKPDYIWLTGLNYKYDMVTYLLARIYNIPLWLRCENQDYVTERSKLKGAIRSFIYKSIYRGFSRFLYIGELNKEHYIKHGVPEKKLTPVKYTTVNRFTNFTNKEKLEIRHKKREEYQLDEHKYVIGFSSKGT
jgi:hypothetical protein